MMRIKAVVFILAFTLVSPAFAVNESANTSAGKGVCTEGEICFAEDLMKEVIKESVQVVGKHILEKYLNKENQPQAENAVQQNTTNTQSTNSTSTTTTTNTTPVTYDTRTGSTTTSTANSASSGSSSADDEIIIID